MRGGSVPFRVPLLGRKMRRFSALFGLRSRRPRRRLGGLLTPLRAPRDYVVKYPIEVVIELCRDLVAHSPDFGDDRIFPVLALSVLAGRLLNRFHRRSPSALRACRAPRA